MTLRIEMPTVRVETNLAFESFPPQFMTLFVYFLADLFGKDKDLMKYVFDTDKRMSMVRCELIHNTEQVGIPFIICLGTVLGYKTR